MDAKGRLGSLLLGWNSPFFQLQNTWDVGSVLCASLFSTEFKEVLCFANIYGPYVEREIFWNLIALIVLR